MLQADNEIYIDTIEEIIEGLGLKLVYYRLISQKNSVKVIIDIHKPDGFVTHKDCSLVIRQCQPFLEEELEQDVQLEVSSPGVNRILKTEREYEVFKGYEVEVYFKNEFIKEQKNETNDKISLRNGDIFILNDYKDKEFFLLPKTSKDSYSKKEEPYNDDKKVKVIDKDNITKIKLLN